MGNTAICDCKIRALQASLAARSLRASGNGKTADHGPRHVPWEKSGLLDKDRQSPVEVEVAVDVVTFSLRVQE
jgi:hypothetical protein